MTSHFPVVLEHESNGTVSAYVVGLPGVFAAADSEKAAATPFEELFRTHRAVLQQLLAEVFGVCAIINGWRSIK